MTIEEWRDVADKLHFFDFTLAAVELDKYYGEGNEFSKRLLEVSDQVVKIKLDLMAQLIKEHPDEEAFKTMFPDDEEDEL
ncbi:Protein of unknown function [Lactobacillus equicursoris DSM 19284 = JCM 14600 = CIP 110162]|uniref:Uncharacterized protein n=1 Tax=Lactobacillus equicursoris DSM 19284 = JCM 14600 = CIP 110162 TaxID=1293597 RepID=K0NLY7_9LACO|nr:hypothetical protein [Lactobacillus equicursoris]KRL00402.1 hypothetical protein FC20_GL001344 [Lactobacillus equicursoris DSM 19284 = JCM 14600 = CIP 110162]CCK86437.1 Protein of unknown function [Lactobacillus equicursoris DSM 19284 = JCM 14600 = CIP 110162]